MAACGDLPGDPELFAHAIVHVVFDGLAAVLDLLNRQSGWHPNELRWDMPEPVKQLGGPRMPMCVPPSANAMHSSGQ